jgi:hypothetical protein
VQFLLASVETRQNDGDRRARHAARLAQPARHGDAAIGKFDAFRGVRQFGGPGRVAAQHSVVGLAEFFRVFGKQVLAVMIIDRGAHTSFGSGQRAALRGSLLGKLLVTRGFGRPAAAPILPARDAAHQFTQIVRIDAGGFIARNEMREDEIDLRIERHIALPFSPGGPTTCRRSSAS